jgi:hypothetical protein
MHSAAESRDAQEVALAHLSRAWDQAFFETVIGFANVGLASRPADGFGTPNDVCGNIVVALSGGFVVY